jgi:Raf kinase inhibitor-like YbhB/YbcL family protein
VTHWIVYHLPSTGNRLREHQPTQARLDNGALQALNARKTEGFLGPKPPAGETHPYHIEVFALNTRLRLDPDSAERKDVVNAMKGHVLASGDLVVSYTGK